MRRLFDRLGALLAGRRIGQKEYAKRVAKEIDNYRDDDNVHDLPDIFHYWSNRYLLPRFQQYGFGHPEDFFLKQIHAACGGLGHVEIASIGSGNCDVEAWIAKELLALGTTNFHFDCLDINEAMLARGEKHAREQGVADHVSGMQGDFNDWQPTKSYDVVLANQSLHHVVELEKLFDAIHSAMTDDGIFLVSDMIGRNGHQRWPEAMTALEPFWNELPQSHRYNRLLKRQEDQYMNHDCSFESFEGIRAQDILPLLVEKFHFDLFIPFGNLIFVFIDRPFGHHFDAEAEWDRDFIDRVHARDEEGMLSGELTPTQMNAILKKHPCETRLTHPKLTPEFCVREPGR